MKNKIYILGLVSVILLICGTIFKTNHWPGANILLILGIFTLCVLFLPIAVISSYKDGGKKKTLLYLAIFITIFIDFAGALFKIMHWPGAGKLMILGITFPIIIFLPVYLYYHYKEQEETQTNFLYVMFLLVYLSVMSALLAVNVSKGIIDDSLRAESLNDLTGYYKLKSAATDTINNKKINELKQKTADLLEYIHSVKTEMVLHDNEDNRWAVNSEGEVNIFKITNNDDHYVPTAIMFQNDKAQEIKKKIDEHHAYLVELSKQNNINSTPISINMLNTGLKDKYREQGVSWEAYNFAHLPFIFVFQNLTDIENNVIMAESELIAVIN